MQSGNVGASLLAIFGRCREQARSHSQAPKGEQNLDCNAGGVLLADSRLSAVEGVPLHSSGLAPIRITACPVAAVYDRRMITTPRSTAVTDRRYRKPSGRK